MLQDAWLAEQTSSFRPQTGVGWPVLTYHLVDPYVSDRNCVTPVQLAQHIDALADNGFVFRAIDDLYAKLPNLNPDNKCVVLAFDDAYACILEYAHPLLNKRKIPYIVFVPVDHVNKPNLWNTKAKYVTRHLSWADLRALAKDATAIGSHGCSHHSLVKLAPQQLLNELKGSRSTLEQELNSPVHYLAYPYGDTNPLVERIAGQYYRLGFSASQGEWSWTNRPWAINRILVHATASADSLLAALKQFFCIFHDG